MKNQCPAAAYEAAVKAKYTQTLASARTSQVDLDFGMPDLVTASRLAKLKNKRK